MLGNLRLRRRDVTPCREGFTLSPSETMYHWELDVRCSVFDVRCSMFGICALCQAILIVYREDRLTHSVPRSPRRRPLPTTHQRGALPMRESRPADQRRHADRHAI